MSGSVNYGKESLPGSAHKTIFCFVKITFVYFTLIFVSKKFNDHN